MGLRHRTLAPMDLGCFLLRQLQRRKQWTLQPGWGGTCGGCQGLLSDESLPSLGLPVPVRVVYLKPPSPSGTAGSGLSPSAPLVYPSLESDEDSPVFKSRSKRRKGSDDAPYSPTGSAVGSASPAHPSGLRTVGPLAL